MIGPVALQRYDRVDRYLEVFTVRATLGSKGKFQGVAQWLCWNRHYPLRFNKGYSRETPDVFIYEAPSMVTRQVVMHPDIRLSYYRKLMLNRG